MTEQLDEKKLLELLELAQIAKQKMKESSVNLTILAEKWQRKTEIRHRKAQK